MLVLSDYVAQKYNFFLKKVHEYLEDKKKVSTFAAQLRETPLVERASQHIGKVVEWSITAVLKTAVPRGTGGSNPSLSADID